ncbi:hypothetical protein FWF74_02325, partial [Candidatus Saccharibacteria bacterium]|nr:hypothetical protein [Candidatus Saccharibacteria bacterium]
MADNQCSVGAYKVKVGAGDFVNVAPGDMICSYLLITDWSYFNGSRVSSVLSSPVHCVEISKQPQMQIRGADSYSGAAYFGGPATSIASGAKSGFASFPTSQERRGSWSQYGLLSNGNTSGNGGPIEHFGSAGWTMSTHNTKYKSGCKLQFANTTS